MTDIHITGLDNYFRLVARVDEHIKTVEKRFQDKITCKKGCDACCRPLNLFPVEALRLAHAFQDLPPADRRIVEQQIDQSMDICPLLIDHECRLYHARPIICRTHGFPVTFRDNNKIMVDFCPENFKGVDSFEKEVLLDLDQLNTILSAINDNFLTQLETDPPLPDRIDIRDALFLQFELQHGRSAPG